MGKRRPKLNPHLFWDIDPEKLDFEKNKGFIIGRVLMHGDLEDFRKIKKYYGEKSFLEEAKRLQYLDPKSLNFLSLIFQIPKEEFLCHRKPWKKQQKIFWGR